MDVYDIIRKIVNSNYKRVLKKIKKKEKLNIIFFSKRKPKMGV